MLFILRHASKVQKRHKIYKSSHKMTKTQQHENMDVACVLHVLNHENMDYTCVFMILISKTLAQPVFSALLRNIISPMF